MRRDIIPIFAEPFVLISDFLDEELRKNLVKRVEECSEHWNGDGEKVWTSQKKSPKNSFNLSEHNQVKEFNILSEKVFSEVQSLADNLDLSYKVSCMQSWYNLYEKDNFQEYHLHPQCTFSSIYFCKMPEGSSPVIFTDFVKQSRSLPKSGNQTFREEPMFSDTHVGDFEENSLVIFRSYIPHQVPIGNNNDDRITFSFNFV